MTGRQQVSLHGRRAFVTDDDFIVGRGGVAAGGDNQPLIAGPFSPGTVAIFDDFINNGNAYGKSDTGTSPNTVAALAGISDTGHAGFYFLTAVGDSGINFSYPTSTNGVFRITPTTTAGTTTVAGTVAQIAQRVATWKANQGPGAGAGRLRFGCRIKRDTFATTGEHGFFVGFTDTVAAEMPVHDTGGTADKGTATNAVGIGWNAGGDTGLMAYAVDGDTVQETPLTTTVPTAGKWIELEVEIRRSAGDTGGRAYFYLNGGSGFGGDSGSVSINNPLNVSTALTPIIAVYDTGGAAITDIDWVAVSGPRDTGT